ncbi:hypothetical protein MKW98_030783, partial [Papaver atlanticum]
MQTVTPEFQVYLNDKAYNEFNTLFASIHLEKSYFVTSVPGSFYGRLFPRVSLHFVHSFISRVPKESGDINSCNASNEVWMPVFYHEVAQAYSAQYVMHMEAFLLAGGHEIICGGLMFILVSAIAEETLLSQTSPGLLLDVLGS